MSLPAPSEILPHRGAALLLDRCVSCDKTSVVCEAVFAPLDGHFPNEPIVPGVALVEALAQALAYWAIHTGVAEQVLLGGLDKVRFYHPVVPGQRVRLKVEVTRVMPPGIIAQGSVLLDGVRVAAARLTGAIKEI